jgi:hypothetical protein
MDNLFASMVNDKNIIAAATVQYTPLSNNGRCFVGRYQNPSRELVEMAAAQWKLRMDEYSSPTVGSPFKLFNGEWAIDVKSYSVD